LAETYGICVTADNCAAAESSTLLVFAVKPQALQAVVTEIAPVLHQRALQNCAPLLLSIAAGVRTPLIQRWLGMHLPVVRAMPNTPALVMSAATALYASPETTAPQQDAAESLLRSVGMTLWVGTEDQLDAVTALSGSGPAYFFYLMEALTAAGTSLGLAPETARLLTLETALGAAKMALESSATPATLRAQVTSPGGTTERAITYFEQHRMRHIVQTAVQQACARAQELAQQLEQS
jgi:pyrroline-5-carboxylate reductase